jgi:hypothetical protein
MPLRYFRKLIRVHNGLKGSSLKYRKQVMDKKILVHKSFQDLLREGYEAMSAVSKRIMNEFKDADHESLKYL